MERRGHIFNILYYPLQVILLLYKRDGIKHRIPFFLWFKPFYFISRTVIDIVICILDICLFITKLYVQLTSSTFQIEIIEWIENLQFLLLLKTWYMLSIRLLNIQLYNFYTFLSLLVYELNAIMGEFFSVLHSLYMNQIQFNAFCNLGRLYLKKKSIKTQLFDSRYFMSV